jgi:hypothetical protein
MKKFAALILFLLFAATSQASILVTTDETDARIDGLEKEFRVGLVNTGEEVNLTLETEGGMEVQHPEKISLEAGSTSNPEGSGWYYSGEDYYPIRYLDLKASIPGDSEKRSHSFDLLITRRYESTRQRPEVEEVRELNFQIFTTSDLIETGFVSEQETGSEEETSRDPDDRERENVKEETVENSTDPSPDRDQSSFPSLTFLLGAGVLVSVAWLLREVVT